MHANHFFSVPEGTGKHEGTCVVLWAWDENIHSL